MNTTMWDNGGQGDDELCNEVEVGLKGVSEHEGLNLVEVGFAKGFLLEERKANPLFRAPYPWSFGSYSTHSGILEIISVAFFPCWEKGETG